MARRKPAHEDHVNHEAWAIPYGDLVTLLLAFFVVMYAVSSINEGKYRVLSDALSEAFGGPPKSLQPIQMGRTALRGSRNDQRLSLINNARIEQSIGGTMRDLRNPQVMPGRIRTQLPQHQVQPGGNTGYEREKVRLHRMAGEIERALHDLIVRDVVTVTRTAFSVEVEIKTDILFASGFAELSPVSDPILQKLGTILSGFPNRVRVEGHTDDRPIHTLRFPTNWELSSARASSVVHRLIGAGIQPRRLSVLGYGEFHPIGDNATETGRNLNRRVLIVVLADRDATTPGDAPPTVGAPLQQGAFNSSALTDPSTQPTPDPS